MKKILTGFMAALAAMTVLSGCEEKRVIYSGPDYLMFSDTLYQCPVREADDDVFDVPVSATRAVDYDRTLAVEIIDKESNAVEGKHYELLSNTVTIKAGELASSVQVKSFYDNIGVSDSLGFALRLVIPDEDKWDLYGTEAKVVLQKVCPFDINNFTGDCVVTSTFFSSDNWTGVAAMRLIKTEVDPEEENTIILHDLYYDGYDVKLKFNTEDDMEPLVEMEEQKLASTADAFIGNIHGNGDLMISQPTAYTSYFSTCEDFVLQYVTLNVYNEDGSLYGSVGTYVNILEWISEGEAEDLRQDGY